VELGGEGKMKSGKKGTRTSPFGVGKREGHDSSPFYGRRLFEGLTFQDTPLGNQPLRRPSQQEAWLNKVFCRSSENMEDIPDGSIALAFTSPPYNNGKEYDQDLSLEEYLQLIERVGREVYRVLVPGGRYVINIANQGRKPYLPLTAYFWNLHMRIGFVPMGEIIWVKGKGASGNCAWGSWLSAKSPRIRDVHEYLLVLGKKETSRPDQGRSTITRDEFLEATLSTWYIPPERAKKVGHPAPFPVELAERVIQLYTYEGDVVLDPFAGSGTTLVAAKKLRRGYVGYEIVPDYCRLIQKRLEGCHAESENGNQ